MQIKMPLKINYQNWIHETFKSSKHMAWAKTASALAPIIGSQLTERRDRLSPSYIDNLRKSCRWLFSWLYSKCPQRKVFPFKNHLNCTVRDMLLSEMLLRKKKKEKQQTTLSRLQVSCSLSWQHILSSNREPENPGLEWMPWFQQGPKWRITFIRSQTPISTLAKSSLGSMSSTLVCFTFKALHLQTVYFFVSCNQFLNSVVFYFFFYPSMVLVV